MRTLFREIFGDPELKFRIKIFIALLLLTLFVRFPFFSISIIDWDEATYILMGQSLLDGNLPYVKFWECKPPLAFFPYAFFIWLFGHSIEAVRVGGAVCVFAVGYMTFLIGDRIWGRKAGLFAGIICIIFSSFMRGGQATLTEFISFVPLTGSLAVLVLRKENSGTFFLAGFLISLAALARLELAYFALFLGAGLLVKSWLFKSLPARYFFIYVCGGLVPVGLTVLPYAVNGYLKIFVDSAIIAPWSYAGTQLSLIPTFAVLISKIFTLQKFLLWMGILGGIALNIKEWKSDATVRNKDTVFLALFLVGTTFAICKTGAGYGHHLIQLAPFMALLSGYFYAYLYDRVNKVLVAIFMLAGLVTYASLLPLAYADLHNKLINNKPLRHDTGYFVAAYLRKANPKRAPIYLADYHIAYWLNDMELPNKLVHPANLAEDVFVKLFFGKHATPEGELRKLLEKKPLFIVKKAQNFYLNNNPAFKSVLENSLMTEYFLETVIDDALIFKRRD